MGDFVAGAIVCFDGICQIHEGTVIGLNNVLKIQH